MVVKEYNKDHIIKLRGRKRTFQSKLTNLILDTGPIKFQSTVFNTFGTFEIQMKFFLFYRKNFTWTNERVHSYTAYFPIIF